MEAIAVIIGEIIFAIVAPVFLLVFNFVSSLLTAIISFLIGLRSDRDGTTKDSPARTETEHNSSISHNTMTPRMRRVARIGTLILAGIALVTLAGAAIVNTFYFSDSVRYVFNTVEKKSGITTTCEDIDGSLFAGRVNLGNCIIQRPSHPTSSFELSLANMNLDLKITSLFGTARLETAQISDLAGWIKNDRTITKSEDSSEDVEKPRRAFVIDQLNVKNVDLELSGVNPDGNPFSLPVNIKHINSQPLRSRMALFDVLFRSNVSGSIAGSPFEIDTSIIESGRKTEWRAPNIPVAALGAVAGGPLAWFSEGSVDVFVVDEWQRGDSLKIDMDWRLRFSDVEVKAPPGTGAFTRIASTPVTSYVNGHDGDFPLEFALVLNESQFESKSSLAAAGLWSAVGDSIKFILTSFHIKADEETDVGGKLKKGAKSVLDRLRKPKSEETD